LPLPITRSRSCCRSVSSPTGCTRRRCGPSLITPAEIEKFTACSRCVSSLRLRLCAVNRSWLIAISTSFGGAPDTSTRATPGMRSIRRLNSRSIMSYAPVRSVLLARRTRSTGWSVVENLKTK